MKGLSLLFLTILLVPTASCTHAEREDVLNFHKDVKQVIFFSDEKQYLLEAAYYDALIELKKKFPEAIGEMQTLSPTTAEPYYKKFNVDGCPAIIVVYNNEIVAKVDGEEELGNIIEPITEVLSER